MPIEHAFVFGEVGAAAGLVIHQAADRILLIGDLCVKSASPEVSYSGVLHGEEKTMDKDAKLCTARILDG